MYTSDTMNNPARKTAPTETPPDAKTTLPPAPIPHSPTVSAMQNLYDRYFASHDYQKRYPGPNLATMAFLMRHGVGSAASIIDIGCGDGRYAVALLDASQAQLTGCDISSQALKEFSSRLAGRPDAHRVNLVHGPVESVPANELFDVALLLFGVLSHAGERPARVAMLRGIRQRTAPGGCLLATVPNLWRRRPWELLCSVYGLLRGTVSTFGDIQFTRVIDGAPRQFFYHLYSIAGLRQELDDAGWQLESTSAESLLPEWLITQHPRMALIDGWIRPLLPASWGYGIRVCARPMARSITESFQTK